MRNLTNRKWMSITLAAVILPIILLTAFKLTGIIPEPVRPETIVIEARNWNGERTPKIHGYNSELENSYFDDTTLISLEVAAGHYDFSWGWTLYDYLNLRIVATANTSEGFVHSITVEFYKGNNYTSAITIYEADPLLRLHNLQLEKVRDTWHGLHEAYILTTAKDRSNNCQLISNVDWVFLNQNVDDNVTVTLKTTYFNGTTYRKIVIPIHVCIRTDAGDKFETAKRITSGWYQGFLWRSDDCEDYYVVSLENGQTIRVRGTPKPYLDIDLYLYDQYKNLIANSSITGSGTEEVAFKAQLAEPYFICLSAPSDFLPEGSYTLTIMVSSDENGG